MGPRFESVKVHQAFSGCVRKDVPWKRVKSSNRNPAERIRFEEEEQGSERRFRRRRKRKRVDFATTRPVGQVVKTAASHAVNIGSNPVRVTSSKLPWRHESPPMARLLSRGGQFFAANPQTLRWFANWEERDLKRCLTGERKKNIIQFVFRSDRIT